MNCGPPTRAALQPLDAAATASTAVCEETSGRVVRATIQSAVYGGPVPISVYMPPCATAAHGPLPVIYLLHGGNADETQWPDLRSLPEADTLIAHGAAPVVVIMPAGDYHMHLDYATFVLTDLLAAAERQFHVSAARSGRAIGGISLGGYWALKIAFDHPELFAAA